MQDIYLGSVVRKYPYPLSPAHPSLSPGPHMVTGRGWLYLSRRGRGWVPALQCTYLQHTSVNFPSLQRRLGGLLAVAGHRHWPAPRPGRGGGRPTPTLIHHRSSSARILLVSHNPAQIQFYVIFNTDTSNL